VGEAASPIPSTHLFIHLTTNNMRLSFNYSSTIALLGLLIPSFMPVQAFGVGASLSGRAEGALGVGPVRVEAQERYDEGLHLGGVPKGERKEVQAVRKEERKQERDEKRDERRGTRPAQARVTSTVTGTVTAATGTTITLRRGNGTTLTVNADGAKLVRRNGVPMLLRDVQVNDRLEVKGAVSGTVMTAALVRNLSLQTQKGIFSGTVTAVSTSTQSFTLHSRFRGDQTVNVTASTTIMKSGQLAAFGDIVTGVRVTVQGTWERTTKQITALFVRSLTRVSATP
jgi:hypothetical protein